MDHITMAGPQVPVHANLLTIWHWSFKKIRACKRFMAYC